MAFHPCAIEDPRGRFYVRAKSQFCDNGVWQVASGSFYRTARRLFEGCVYA
jgi:2-methylaconitate cis-trans-isomerase PrpF